MDVETFIDLKHPYKSFLEKAKWKDYVSTFSQEGLTWWFNMEIPSIASHLTPLSKLPKGISLPSRLLLLSEVIQADIPIERIEAFYFTFLKEHDFEGASAAAGSAIASIWDGGTNFKRFDVWYKRINQLLEKEKSLSSLAKASLLGFKALIEIAYRGNITKAEKTLKSQLHWAEMANSNSLRVFYSVMMGYCFSYSGDLERLELILAEAAPLCESPGTSLICQIYFRLIQGLFWIIKGNILEAKRILRQTIAHPSFDALPSSIWLLGKGHLLLATAFGGELQEVDALAKKIQERVIPSRNHFHQGYAHFNLGIASLVLGEPYKALLHSQQLAECGHLSHSPISEQFAAFLTGQALSDLGNFEEAFAHLTLWLKKWQATGFNIFAAAGALEMAHLLTKSGRLREAREYYEKATSILPEKEKIPTLYRPPKFLSKLKQALYPEPIDAQDWLEQDYAPIRIQTFGELRVQLGDHFIYDRKWHGGRTKKLLKALIVFGGNKISEDLLFDTLWPDADGDTAMTNLKVALSRLRRIGGKKMEEPLPWVVVKHRHVSLAKSLCVVDSIQFKNALTLAMKKKDKDLLAKVLDLYKDDFLVNDESETWIINHREILREDFIKGVMILSDLCFTGERIEEALPYLQKALEKDPLHEALYAYLMRAYLKMGYPSNALRVFQKAKQILKKELDIEPGAALISLAQEAMGKNKKG